MVYDASSVAKATTRLSLNMIENTTESTFYSQLIST